MRRIGKAFSTRRCRPGIDNILRLESSASRLSLIVAEDLTNVRRTISGEDDPREVATPSPRSGST